jgi:hypothetical protein
MAAASARRPALIKRVASNMPAGKNSFIIITFCWDPAIRAGFRQRRFGDRQE